MCVERLAELLPLWDGQDREPRIALVADHEEGRANGVLAGFVDELQVFRDSALAEQDLVVVLQNGGEHPGDPRLVDALVRLLVPLFVGELELLAESLL